MSAGTTTFDPRPLHRGGWDWSGSREGVPLASVRAVIRREHRLIRLAVAWAITGALVVAAGSPAYACVCDLTAPLEGIDEFDGAFVGTVTDVAGEGGGHTVAAATFRVESAVIGRFDPLVHVSGPGTSCALELEVGQRTGLLVHEGLNGLWEAGLCQQVLPELLAAPSTSAPVPDVTPIGAGHSGASFPWWAMGLAVGLVITGSMIVLVRRRRPGG